MAQNDNTTAPLSDNGTVKALVTLTVAPKEGQTPGEAAEEMLGLFTEYLTSREGMFMSDYGTTAEELQEFRESGNDLDAQPTWGGYDGPFVLESRVEAVA